MRQFNVNHTITREQRLSIFFRRLFFSVTNFCSASSINFNSIHVIRFGSLSIFIFFYLNFFVRFSGPRSTLINFGPIYFTSDSSVGTWELRGRERKMTPSMFGLHLKHSGDYCEGYEEAREINLRWLWNPLAGFVIRVQWHNKRGLYIIQFVLWSSNTWWGTKRNG